jgi:hypothetical protein
MVLASVPLTRVSDTSVLGRVATSAIDSARSRPFESWFPSPAQRGRTRGWGPRGGGVFEARREARDHVRPSRGSPPRRGRARSATRSARSRPFESWFPSPAQRGRTRGWGPRGGGVFEARREARDHVRPSRGSPPRRGRARSATRSARSRPFESWFPSPAQRGRTRGWGPRGGGVFEARREARDHVRPSRGSPPRRGRARSATRSARSRPFESWFPSPAQRGRTRGWGPRGGGVFEARPRSNATRSTPRPMHAHASH